MTRLEALDATISTTLRAADSLAGLRAMGASPEDIRHALDALSAAAEAAQDAAAPWQIGAHQHAWGSTARSGGRIPATAAMCAELDRYDAVAGPLRGSTSAADLRVAGALGAVQVGDEQIRASVALEALGQPGDRAVIEVRGPAPYGDVAAVSLRCGHARAVVACLRRLDAPVRPALVVGAP